MYQQRLLLFSLPTKQIILLSVTVAITWKVLKNSILEIVQKVILSFLSQFQQSYHERAPWFITRNKFWLYDAVNDKFIMLLGSDTIRELGSETIRCWDN